MAEIRGYHAHVDYHAEMKPVAERLRETLIEKFAVEPRAMRDEPRGPHTSYRWEPFPPAAPRLRDQCTARPNSV
jgi:aromatic ring-cleaving dioxygenase